MAKCLDHVRLGTALGALYELRRTIRTQIYAKATALAQILVDRSRERLYRHLLREHRGRSRRGRSLCLGNAVRDVLWALRAAREEHAVHRSVHGPQFRMRLHEEAVGTQGQVENLADPDTAFGWY